MGLARYFPKAELLLNGKIQGEVLLQIVLFSLLSFLFFKTFINAFRSLLKLISFLVNIDLGVEAQNIFLLLRTTIVTCYCSLSMKLVDLLLLFMLIASI